MKYVLTSIVLLFTTMAFSQKVTVKGTVIDSETKEPLPFVTVWTDSHGSKKGVKTDFDGEYTLVLPNQGEWTLTFSCKHEGYVDKVETIHFDSDTTIVLNIALNKSAEIQNLQAVMVKGSKRKVSSTVTVEKSRSRYTADELSSNEMKKRRTTTAADAVQSTPGVSRTKESPRKRRKFEKHSIPVTTTDSRYNEIQDNTFVNVKREPLSTFSIDVDKGAYTQMRRFIRSNRLPHPDVVRIEEFINYFDYDYPQPEGDVPFSVTTEYTHCPWNDAHKLALIGIQGEQKQLDEAESNNLVFLLDVSGSMLGEDRLQLIKSGMLMLVDELRSQDKISIITYAGGSSLVLDATKGSEKDKIKEAISNLTAAGSTNGSGAIQLAYEIAEKNFRKNGNNRIILATDGDFNVGATGEHQLIKIIEEKRESGVFLSILGVGTGNFQDAKMEQIADHGNGNYYYLDNLLEAKRTIVNGMQGLLYTIAKDVKLQIEFNPEHVQSYRLIGYANRMLAEEDFNDDTKDAGELGAGHTVTAIYEIIPKGTEEANAPKVDPLKYQSETLTDNSGYTDELFTVKLRYKKPDEKKSQLISRTCPAKLTSMENASENIRFASSVAEFGLLLRDSEYKGTASFQNVIERAKMAKGKDEEGIRAEFIQLVESAELLENNRSEK